MNIKSVKKRIYRIIQPYKKYDTVSKVFDWFIILLVIVDIITTIIDTMPISASVLRIINVIEVFTVMVFSVEYLLRIWTADFLYIKTKPHVARLKYAFTFFMLMDLFATAPFLLKFIFPINIYVLRAFRLLRVFRLFKIKNYIKTFSHVGDVLRKKASQLIISMVMMLTIMIVASILMYTAEYEAQPEVFSNALSGLWWAVITLTTVGYGDIYPVTVLGKVIGAFFSIVSIALIAVPTGIISAGFIESSQKRRTESKKTKHFCPFCGENIEE